MKKLILILIVLFSISCQKEETKQEILTKKVTYNVTGERIYYSLTVSDENGEPFVFEKLTGPQSISITADLDADIFMQYKSMGYSYETELEILINDKRVDYWQGDLEGDDVIFLND